MALKFINDLLSPTGAETQSVILLRQVPIRFDEVARSWLGGLPQMPEGMAWPRSDAGVPLQFVTQVCCADLPKMTWGGRGPRKGWLLLFLDRYAMAEDGESYGGIVQVLHIDQLGPEREPPEDMGTIRHAMIDRIGGDQPIFRQGVPKMWRRWPVDLIVQEVPPAVEEDGDLTWRPLPVDAAALYGAPVKDDNLHGFIDIEQKPMTWRGALYLMDKLADDLKSDVWGQTRKVRDMEDGVSKLLTWTPGLVARVLEREEANRQKFLAKLKEIEAQAAEWRQQNPDGPDDQRATWEALIQSKKSGLSYYERVLQDLTAYAGPDGDEALKAEVRRSEHDMLAWLNAQLQTIAALRAEILLQDLNAQLPDADWAAMHVRITEPLAVTWEMNFDTPYISRSTSSLLSNVQSALKMARREDLLDLYTQDAASRALIPPKILAELEPLLRSIGYPQAPHRMGGPQDAVHVYDTPDNRHLLFQIYSDYAMGWLWGDVGGLFVTMDSSDLKANRFDRMEATLQGH